MDFNFKENLRNELNYQGVIVKELSARTGIPIATLDCYLGTRATIPSVEAAYKIAHALNVSVEYLIAGKEMRQKIPAEAKTAAEIIAQMEEKNRKMAINIIKSMKKQEDDEKKRK